ETRILEKVSSAPGAASWTMRSYQWSADHNSVSLVPPAGASDVLGTDHDIPSQAQCQTCHATMAGADIALGFEAIQLNHDAAGVTLASPIEGVMLWNSSGATNVSTANATIPGSANVQNALGYLHANCGHCHGGSTPFAGMSLWSRVGTPDLAH